MRPSLHPQYSRPRHVRVTGNFVPAGTTVATIVNATTITITQPVGFTLPQNYTYSPMALFNEGGDNAWAGAIGLKTGFNVNTWANTQLDITGVISGRVRVELLDQVGRWQPDTRTDRRAPARSQPAPTA